MKFKFPITVNIFLTMFHFFNILLVVTLVLALTGFIIPAIVTGVIMLVIGIFNLKSDLTGTSIIKGILFSGIRYGVNLALFAGSFLGGLKSKMLFISATLD
jgi:hypothetical protein